MGLLKGATGKTATIIRATGNLSLAVYIKPSRGATSPYIKEYICDSEAFYVTKRYDIAGSEILSVPVEGDIIKDGEDYYILMTLNKVEMDNPFYLKGVLFKCNSTITVNTYNSVTRTFTEFAVNVPCLIAREQNMGRSDSGIGLQTGSSVSGFYVYAQNSSGINLKANFTDQDGKRFRVSDSVNPFYSNGVTEAKIVWENR